MWWWWCAIPHILDYQLDFLLEHHERYHSGYIQVYNYHLDNLLEYVCQYVQRYLNWYIQIYNHCLDYKLEYCWHNQYYNI